MWTVLRSHSARWFGCIWSPHGTAQFCCHNSCQAITYSTIKRPHISAPQVDCLVLLLLQQKVCPPYACMLCAPYKTDMYSVLQIIDRLCASAHYRQAVSCENSGASMAASPSSDCLLRITMSHHKVVHLRASPQQAAASPAPGHSSLFSPSQMTST